MNIQNTLLKSAPSGNGTASAATGASASAATSSPAAGGGTAQATKDASDRFLTLLVAQLQNQDPLNPLDNAQVTTQLAQISTVSGINQLNATVAALGASMGVSQSMQAASLVGHDVVVGGNSLDLVTSKDAGAKATGGVSLASDADQVRVTISDASGSPVRTIDLGAQKAGDQFFTWDGMTDSGSAAADGPYTFSVTATAAGKAVAADPLMQARVQGVSASAGGVTLQLPDGSQVAFADVKQIQ